MSPREVRALVRAEKVVIKGSPPAPPPEWPAYRREALSVCIRAALLFLKNDLRAKAVQERIGLPGAHKQRIGFMINRGCAFLISRGYIEVPGGRAPYPQVKRKRKKAA